jgi:DNA (cytosine-5)-methyltransferase 1
MEFENFRKWLINKIGYKNKSAGDVISRIRRIRKFIKVPEPIEPITLFQLQQNEEYKKLSLSVRSQLKKALLLFSEFQRTNN